MPPGGDGGGVGTAPSGAIAPASANTRGKMSPLEDAAVCGGDALGALWIRVAAGTGGRFSISLCARILRNLSSVSGMTSQDPMNTIHRQPRAASSMLSVLYVG